MKRPVAWMTSATFGFVLMLLLLGLLHGSARAAASGCIDLKGAPIPCPPSTDKHKRPTPTDIPPTPTATAVDTATPLPTATLAAASGVVAPTAVVCSNPAPAPAPSPAPGAPSNPLGSLRCLKQANSAAIRSRYEKAV